MAMDMRKMLMTAAAALVACPLSAVVLVEDGKARAEIVLPEKAWPAEKLAAEELRFLLKKASGADLAVVEKGDNILCLLAAHTEFFCNDADNIHRFSF